jgi:hypothetical protein
MAQSLLKWCFTGQHRNNGLSQWWSALNKILISSRSRAKNCLTLLTPGNCRFLHYNIYAWSSRCRTKWPLFMQGAVPSKCWKLFIVVVQQSIVLWKGKKSSVKCVWWDSDTKRVYKKLWTQELKNLEKHVMIFSI